MSFFNAAKESKTAVILSGPERNNRISTKVHFLRHGKGEYVYPVAAGNGD